MYPVKLKLILLTMGPPGLPKLTAMKLLMEYVTRLTSLYGPLKHLPLVHRVTPVTAIVLIPLLPQRQPITALIRILHVVDDESFEFVTISDVAAVLKLFTPQLHPPKFVSILCMRVGERFTLPGPIERLAVLIMLTEQFLDPISITLLLPPEVVVTVLRPTFVVSISLRPRLARPLLILASLGVENR